MAQMMEVALYSQTFTDTTKITDAFMDIYFLNPKYVHFFVPPTEYLFVFK